MNYQLPLLVIIPVLAMVFEYIISKLKIKYDGILPLISALAITVISIYIATNVDLASAGRQMQMNLPWISSWGISFSLSTDGLSAIFCVLLSLLFLIMTVLCFNKKKGCTYWCMNLLVQALILNFIISDNLVVRVLSWELIWLPIFIILIGSDKEHYSIKLSNSWLLTQLLILSGTVIMVGKFDKIYNVAFWLFMLTILFRSCTFPYNRTIKKLSERFAPEISMLTLVILPLVPIIFLTNTILPLFSSYLHADINTIAIFLCINCLIWIIKLITSRSISMIAITNICVFYSLIIIWLINPTIETLQLCTLLIISKSILNLVILYYGNNTSSELNKWGFISAIILSFGFTGVVIGTPILKLISYWDSFQRPIAITTLVLITLMFMTTVVKLKGLFKYKKTILLGGWPEIIKLAVVVIVFTGAVITSIDPTYVNKMVKHYYITNMAGGK